LLMRKNSSTTLVFPLHHTEHGNNCCQVLITSFQDFANCKCKHVVRDGFTTLQSCIFFSFIYCTGLDF
ncbi:unnamed protein product, partial [Dicrocoelium dendriticum]